MTHILGIMGSPRKGGNTHMLMKEMARAVTDGGGSMAIEGLSGLEVGECDGCHVCWSGNPCSKKDDMNRLFPLIAEADAMVFGTPVYWYGPTALMKLFIDRFVFFNCEAHRAMIAGKVAAVVVPFEETSDETVAPVMRFFERSLGYLEMPLVGRLPVPGVTRRGEVGDRPELMRGAYDLGTRLLREAAPS